MAVKIVIKKKAAPAEMPAPVVPKKAPNRSGAVLDGMCKAVMATGPNAVVSWWLMASYAYYVHDESMLSDGLYDEMARSMLARWDQIVHPHKHLIEPGDLEQGSLYRLAPADYPSMVRGAVAHLLHGEWGIKLDPERGITKEG